MTAAINSRTFVSTSHAEELETAPKQPAVAAPPPPRKPSNDNRVESWSGHVPVAQRTAAEVLAELDKKMNPGLPGALRDFFVKEKNANESVRMLGELPPAEYKKAFESMKFTTLESLLTEMDPETRQTFFAQARSKGLIQEEPGVKMPPREGSPPDKPALIRNEPSLPMELRLAIHEENVTRTAQYMRDFDAYIDRYSQAALNASSPLSLRLMGPPMGEFVLTEPGVNWKDKGLPQSLHQGATHRARAAKAVNDRISDFAGRTRAGSFTATFDAKVEVSTARAGGEISLKASMTDYGKTESKLKAEADVGVTKGLSVGLTSDGKAFEELKAGDYRIRAEGGAVTELEGKIAGVGVSLSDGKSTFSLGVDQVPVKVFAAIDDKHGSYGGGVKLGGEQNFGGVATVKAEVKLGVMVQGIAPERLAYIASMKDDGIWGPMPELDHRVKWNAIPEERRKHLSSDGWSSANWPNR